LIGGTVSRVTSYASLSGYINYLPLLRGSRSSLTVIQLVSTTPARSAVFPSWLSVNPLSALVPFPLVVTGSLRSWSIGQHHGQTVPEPARGAGGVHCGLGGGFATTK